MIFTFSFIVKEIGEREGKFYAINVPLKDGIDDASFNRLFKTVSCNCKSQIFRIHAFLRVLIVSFDMTCPLCRL